MREQLCTKSEDMAYDFQKLFYATRNSLSERNISVADLVHHIECLGCLKPTYNDLHLPPLRHQLPGLAQAKTVHTVMSIVRDYCSFFNYRMLEHIIEEFGIKEDKTNLSKYKEKFKAYYAECCVFDCPLEVGTMSEEGHANMFVTLDDSFESCTLSHVNAFIGNLRKTLNISSDVALKLCRISPGSLKLIFQMLQSFQKAIFPLSSDQEEALADLGVVQLACGDYQFAIQKTCEEIEDLATCGDSSSYQTDSETNTESDTYDTELASLAIKIPVRKKKQAFSLADSGIGGSSAVSGTTAGMVSDLLEEEVDDIDMSIAIAQNATDGSNTYVLFKAAQKGDTEEVKELIENKSLNPLQEDEHGQNSLHLAARGGHIGVMKYLSEERGHNPASQSFTGRTAGWTPLHHATVCNQLEMVKYLVDEQLVDPLCQAEDGSAPQHLACVGGNVEVVAYLVKEMSKYLPLKDIVNCKNNEGAAPIHTATLCGHLEVIKYFTTEINCDPNVIVTGDCSNRSIKCGGRIALHHAAQRGHLNMVKFLVEQQKCNPTHMDDNKVTPLHMAAQAGHLDTVSYLAIDQRCDFSCANCSNDTPLHHAARCGHLQVVKFFVDALHCPTNIKGQCNKTPLEQARNRGHHRVVNYLAAYC